MHILTAEGYAGAGVDVRARTSWNHYPEHTRKCLYVAPLNPLALFADGGEDGEDSASLSVDVDDPIARIRALLRLGAFLIANHADELSPWTPVLATLTHASGCFSIPCCAWSLDGRFVRA